MMVLPAASIIVAPCGISTDEAGPTAAILSPTMTMVPSAISPAPSPVIVRIFAPVIATVARGLSALTVRSSDVPEVGGTNFGASLSFGALANIDARLAR